MSTPPTIGFISLGCPQATVDTEQIITQLRGDGYTLTEGYDDAELVIINTCGFIESAVEESLDVIGEALAENGKVIVTGCLGHRAELIKSHFPQVLAVTGPHDLQAVMAQVRQHQPLPNTPFEELLPPAGIKLTPSHYAYLKIAEGCHHSCRFCVIPSLRGTLRSRPIGDIMEEAQNLVDTGVKELLVTSQDSSAYGVDIQHRTGFWGGRPIKSRTQELTEALADLGVWIRLHNLYPAAAIDNLLPLMAEGRILPYLDIPFQHASQSVLKAMKRPANSENVLRRIEKWREICPEITLRSTFIVGFPGETEQDFDELLDFIDEAQLDRVGCFTYSEVEGATSNQLPNHVDEETKQDRLDRFMTRQASISADKLKQKIGLNMKVLVDDVEEDGTVIARSYADAPEIDGLVIVESTESARPGEFLDVTITNSDEHDLYAIANED